MPYIDAQNDRREALRTRYTAVSAGELNYQIFYYVKHSQKYKKNPFTDYHIIKEFVDNFLTKKPNYQRYNDMTGALIRCYKEIKRRLGIDVKDLFIEIIDSYDDVIAKYEDTKIVSNGDVE